jgi:uncharacterized protein YlxW (UPF0749 family)
MRPRISRGQLLGAALCALLGFALVVQVRQTQEQGLESLRQTDLVNVLDNVTRESQRLENDSAALQETLDRLSSGSGNSQAAQEAARQRLEVLGILVGTLPAQGKGIELVIDDPRGEVNASVLLDTLQELRDAGAEAVQIGNVRVVASTSFVDVPEGVRVDGTVLERPFRMKVIGDPETLSSALDIPGGVLEVLRQKGAEGRIAKPATVTIDALRAVRPPQYARPAPDQAP